MFGSVRMEASLLFVSVLCLNLMLSTTVSTSNKTKDQNSTASNNPSPAKSNGHNKTATTKCLEMKNSTGGACGSCQQGYAGEGCDKCENGWYGDLTNLNDTCKLCNCSGNLDLQQSDSCHPVTGVCQKCLPNTSGLYCETCIEGLHGDAIVTKNCTSDVASIAHDSRKELLIIVTCSVAGACCLIALVAFLCHRYWKKRFRKECGSFWKVELSNRNYDNLDFSLLDPVTDTPLVFRADIAGFDEDALLASEKPQLILETEEIIC